ncbi:MAG: glyoxylate/hydroxypyruvate reductase A [Pseudomonadota bacterium]
MTDPMRKNARPRVLYAGRPAEAEAWMKALHSASHEAALEIEATSDLDRFEPSLVDYVLFTPSGTIDDLRPYTGLKGVLSLWAGVETFLDRPDLPVSAPLVRMVEPGLTEGMTDYVVAHAMRYHMDLDGALKRSAERRWDDVHPPLSRLRTVGILGLGALGQDAARTLRALRFNVIGWSRTQKTIEGVTCFAGHDGLEKVLSTSEILIVLLPQTPETVGLLNAERLALLPKGAYVINAARGPVLPEADLLSALEDGLGGATLDVFDEEPLPETHPYWAHEKITITPHVASVTRPETASKEVVRQIKRVESGMPFEHVVDKTRGY